VLSFALFCFLFNLYSLFFVIPCHDTRRHSVPRHGIFLVLSYTREIPDQVRNDCLFLGSHYLDLLRRPPLQPLKGNKPFFFTLSLSISFVFLLLVALKLLSLDSLFVLWRLSVVAFLYLVAQYLAHANFVLVLT
jgi:hypothetical protein